jgi:transcriptional regulator with XRE-family HTH domain
MEDLSETLIFSERFRLLRKKNKLTQAGMGEILGIKGATISSYETGNSQPDLSMLLLISKKLKVSSDYLLGISDVENQADFTNLNNSSIKNLATVDDGVSFVSESEQNYTPMTEEERSQFLEMQKKIASLEEQMKTLLEETNLRLAKLLEKSDTNG